jgi:hypothetical protein
MVSSSTRMADKMPVVSGLGEQFAWANLMFDSNATDDWINGTGMWGNGTNGTGVIAAVADIPSRMARSLAGGAKGMNTFARIGTRRFNRWDTRRKERNESYGTVLAQKGGVVVDAVRRLLPSMATTIDMLGSSNATNSTWSVGGFIAMLRSSNATNSTENATDLNETEAELCEIFGQAVAPAGRRGRRGRSASYDEPTNAPTDAPTDDESSTESTESTESTLSSIDKYVPNAAVSAKHLFRVLYNITTRALEKCVNHYY